MKTTYSRIKGERYLVKPGQHFSLSNYDPDDRKAFAGDKEDAQKLFQAFHPRLSELQHLLYAEHRQKILIIFQAMDTGGKDSTIRFVFEGVNPQGVFVRSYKSPTVEELDHDYLWRVHQHVPGKGEIGIFNRSHYEDVLIVRVHKLVPMHVWKRRFDQINEFEKMLTQEGITILKFFLNISEEEQKKRLQERIDDPQKRWKFNADDLKERQRWNQYMKAYEETISQTSTIWAPWYIVPANTKWYRNLIVVGTIVRVLEDLKMTYPQSKIPAKDFHIR